MQTEPPEDHPGNASDASAPAVDDGSSAPESPEIAGAPAPQDPMDAADAEQPLKRQGAADPQTSPDKHVPVVKKPTAGHLLQQERLRQGLSDKEIAHQLRITRHYVQSIEADQYDKLPGQIFARGYIKGYAAILGLDATELLTAYDDFTGHARDREPESSRMPIVSRPPANRQWLVLTTVIAIGGLIVTAIWWWLQAG